MAEKDEDPLSANTEPNSTQTPSVLGPAVVGGLIGLVVYAALVAGAYFGLGLATRFPQTGPPPVVYIGLAIALITTVGGGAVLGIKIALNKSHQQAPKE
jgi:hypothetical protein